MAELRKAAGFSQAEMAERLEMAVEGYRRWERGELNVTVNTLVRIARVLGVQVRDFFG
jgi:transcriptional regulator with XRE-family HTH domain